MGSSPKSISPAALTLTPLPTPRFYHEPSRLRAARVKVSTVDIFHDIKFDYVDDHREMCFPITLQLVFCILIYCLCVVLWALRPV